MGSNRKGLLPVVWMGGAVALLTGLVVGVPRPGPGPFVNSTAADFQAPGTRPGDYKDPFIEAWQCSSCHGWYNNEQAPYERWTASMMGQGARDPLFWAALAIAEQAAPGVEDFCIKCHAPMGWVQNQPAVHEGVNCNFCHRMVDPVYVHGKSPAIDQPILAALKELPQGTHSGQFVLDPYDRRRGPFALPDSFDYHAWQKSDFHTDARMCATCHDVSNPLFMRQADGSYKLDTLDKEHPTHKVGDGFPLERTFGEWSQSAFARGPIDMGGRFGGNRKQVSMCQDCHMPKTTGTACNPMLGGAWREDLPQHDFRGATTWMLRSVRNLYPDWQTALTFQSVEEAIARNEDMLGRSADLFLFKSGGELLVRTVNQTGHKLPTGHLEGRRMWLNAVFFDASGLPVSEAGHYDFDTAVLTPGGTKVYEAIVGLDQAMANYLGGGVQAGPSHLFPLNNTFYLDNRIPPRGFTNAGFASVQSAPVNYTYRDGQYWDDTRYALPPGSARARVRLYYQAITKEAVEGLRDHNTTTNHGQVLYNQWLANDKGPPVLMAEVEIDLLAACRADFDGSGRLNPSDVVAFHEAHRAGDPRADINDDGVIGVRDVQAYMRLYRLGCP